MNLSSLKKEGDLCHISTVCGHRSKRFRVNGRGRIALKSAVVPAYVNSEVALVDRCLTLHTSILNMYVLDYACWPGVSTDESHRATVIA